jgi:hypothetical protein
MWPNGDMNNGAFVPLAGPVFLLRLAKNQDAPITAAGHRKDYERERDRADTLMAELLKSTADVLPIVGHGELKVVRIPGESTAARNNERSWIGACWFPGPRGRGGIERPLRIADLLRRHRRHCRHHRTPKNGHADHHDRSCNHSSPLHAGGSNPAGAGSCSPPQHAAAPHRNLLARH